MHHTNFGIGFLIQQAFLLVWHGLVLVSMRPHSVRSRWKFPPRLAEPVSGGSEDEHAARG